MQLFSRYVFILVHRIDCARLFTTFNILSIILFASIGKYIYCKYVSISGISIVYNIFIYSIIYCSDLDGVQKLHSALENTRQGKDESFLIVFAAFIWFRLLIFFIKYERKLVAVESNKCAFYILF